MSQVGADVVLHEPNGETLTVRNTILASFTDSQFLLPLDTSKLGAMTFDDEFTRLSLYDPSTQTGLWQTNFGGNLKDQWAYTLPSNGEQQVYVAPGFAGRGSADLGIDPFSIANGVLTITASQIPADQVYAAFGHNYASGMLNTMGSFEQKYGYFEMRAALPSATGAWPAFWMMPSPYQPNAEADIMEALGATPSVDYRRAYGGSQTQYDNALKLDPTGFHTYGMLWTAQTVTFYFDGTEVLSGLTPSTWTSPMAMIVNMAVGGWGGNPDASAFPAQMQIDYVRAYALADGSSQVAHTTPTPPAGTIQVDPTAAAGAPTIAPALFDDTGGAVTAATVQVFAAKPMTPVADHTFAIWADSGAVFGALSHGGVLDTPTPLMAGDVSNFNGAAAWLTDESVAFSYFQPNPAGGKDAWVVVFDTGTRTFLREDLGSATSDIHLAATAHGGFAASWKAPDGTIMGRVFDAYAYDGAGWLGPATPLSGDLLGVTGAGELVAAKGTAQQLYTVPATSIWPVGAVSIGDGSAVSETLTGSGPTEFTFTLTRTGAFYERATVAWTVQGAGAHPADASEFVGGVLPSGVATFAINQVTATVTVEIAPNANPQPETDFQLSLKNPDGTALGPFSSVTGEIMQPASPSAAGASGGATGLTLTSATYGDTLVGGAGADTLNAGRGPDTLTGGGGADTFAFAKLPWNAGHITDFTLGSDTLDLSALFQASHYTGADPVKDGYVSFQPDGGGGTKVFYATDGTGSGNTINYLITDLDHVSPAGLTWSQLEGVSAPATPAPTSGGGQTPGLTLTSSSYGDTLMGGAGNDTVTAGQGPDTLTGSAGSDIFIYAKLPWNAGHVTDFTPGADKLDLRALFTQSGYTGVDPLADHYLSFQADGSGNTRVYFDSDGPAGSQWPTLITTLDHVLPSQLSNADWLFH